jgi:malonyl-CoA decarboxylase
MERSSPPTGSAVSRLLASFSGRGRALLARYGLVPAPAEAAAGAGAAMVALGHALLSARGEASGVALARDLLALYRAAGDAERQRFLVALARDFDPDPEHLKVAWAGYAAAGATALPALAAAAEPPRQELIRRLNLAPGGTAALVAMRTDLLRFARAEPDLARVDADFRHLFQSWFNRGFLQMRAIDWASPGHLLERIIRYEAVHDISDWDDLRRRLDPPDRRCFGFFHPAMPDEPLIFVEVALTRGMAGNIQQILAPERIPLAAAEADTAVFYSISNCQEGLRGVSFGHFLIKQVAEDLRAAHPGLAQFVTLSPLPGLRRWLRGEQAELATALDGQGVDGPEAWAGLRQDLTTAALRYLVEARNDAGRPLDPVARFHLGNGARLERLNWMADNSAKGLAQGAGFMVNYLYDLRQIEENHEAYAASGTIALGKALREAWRAAGGAAMRQAAPARGTEG